MEEIKSGNEPVYWPGDVVTLSEVASIKITVTEKRKGHSELT